MVLRDEDTGAAVEAGSGAKRPVDYTIGVLTKALDLLDVLSEHTALSLTEAGRKAGINKVTAFRILTNLEERRYVERDAPTGRYRLGLRLLELGTQVSQRLELRAVARPVLERLQAETGETANLAVAVPEGTAYIDILESTRGLRMAATVGARDDYHSTSLGKAIAAGWSPERLDAYLRHATLTTKTPHTITNEAALRRELQETSKRGYAVDDEENEIGARCVGAPIFDHRGEVIGAISISGPASRVTRERAAEIGEQVVRAAREITAQLGGHTDE
ncbi:MAG: IclR family transcriptional regulator [Chloroflexi bacterium]|nr:IclR family transcriptional regulator [Chloroflexota bacterium]